MTLDERYSSLYAPQYAHPPSSPVWTVGLLGNRVCMPWVSQAPAEVPSSHLLPPWWAPAPALSTDSEDLQVCSAGS